MARPHFRFPVIDLLAFLGILLGGWLIQQTFQPMSDLPNRALLVIAGLDLLLCFCVLGYRLRRRLQNREGLAGYWIIAGSVGLAWFLGWIAALFIDADRVALEQKYCQDYDQQTVKLIENLRHFGDVLPANQASADHGAWQVNHDRYVRLFDQMRMTPRANPSWEKHLTRVHEQVDAMHKKFLVFFAEPNFEQRIKWRRDYQDARENAVQSAEALRGEIAQSERALANTHRVRWQSIGSAALTGVVLILGALMMWIVFDRELRRVWRRHHRLALDEARYRALVEQQTDALAVLDAAGNFLYVNPAWLTAFGHESGELLGRNLYGLIHADDLLRVRSTPVQTPIPCRFSADYGLWHDVEMVCQPPADDGTMIVRVRDRQATPDADARPQPPMELQREIARLRDRDAAGQRELQEQRWLLEAHQQANTEGVLILSADGDMLSWNHAFLRMWSLSNETMSAHTWQTIVAHMESLVETGWDDFRRSAIGREAGQTDTCWEMTLEGGRTVEVYAQALRDHPTRTGALQLHFRDVTTHKRLEARLRDAIDPPHPLRVSA
jgi:PAS domain-containing protein